MKSILNILENDVTLTALLTDGADGVFIDREPQEATPPYVVVMSDIDDSNVTFNGENLDMLSVRVFSLSEQKYTANSINGAQEVADAVRSALVGSKGTHGGENYHITSLESESTFVNSEINFPRYEVEQEYTVFRPR